MLIGIISVIIFLSILILVHELGHFLAAKKFGLLVEEFGFGLPPRIWSKKIGDTIYSINALPIGGFVKIFGEDGIDSENSDSSVDSGRGKRNFKFLPMWQRGLILSAGVLMNFVLGWFIISIVFFVGLPQAIFITEVVPDSPAAEIGLIVGDKITNFLKLDEFIEYVNDNKGKEIGLEIERLGKVFSVQAVPRINPPKGQGALGVALVEGGSPKMGLFSSFYEGFKSSIGIIESIAVAIFGLIKSAVVGEATMESVAGPVGIVKITAQAGSLGFIYLLQLLALISLNLAVINIIPFPALDGGRLLFLAIEKIKGSPLNPKFERFANAGGMALLLLLMLLITIKDISRFF